MTEEMSGTKLPRTGLVKKTGSAKERTKLHQLTRQNTSTELFESVNSPQEREWKREVKTSRLKTAEEIGAR